MRPNETRALGELTGKALSGGTARVRQMHRGIAARVFRGVGPAAAPVRVLHDGIADAVYSTVGGTFSAAGRAAGRVLAEASDGRPLEDDRRAAVPLAMLNAWHGDRLRDEGSPLALEMTVRVDGRNVPIRPDVLAETHPDPAGRVAVFLHGLTETEGAWAYKSVQYYGRPGVTYGDRLREDLGYTPVQIRYNTGARIPANGRELAALLEDLVAAWPVPVEDLLLVGHSMGGLVIRSALAQAGDRAWPALVRDTVTLGSPHLGAPLEQGATLLARALGVLGETRSIATIIDGRSAGIKDLRRGTLLEDEEADVPLHEGARHFIVVATVAGRDGSLAGNLLGDLLVRPDSACGTRRFELPPEHICRLPRLHHFDLLNHPDVYDRIHGWLTARPADEPAGAED
ncbi:lipase family alpha/beta hydrolase [Actinomadura macrotermitis]|uniref:GPI inositol-deacylase PGAP1-like alpha/beta domain-containing protein n=1 Tax=Actinomadura macrotermitis TaxID=2585200 RepID=A0A7K0BYS5_9ACTN|nr:alpha/beta hydrolase [Actinomadura macrotermitis]MQY06323.1 hypothetical protein [Actinomadura macrotermitis]